MPTKSWRKSTPVTNKLQAAPTEYSFQQVVRLLERASHYSNNQKQLTFAPNPVAQFTPPSSECVRIFSGTSLAFPSAEVSEIKIKESDGRGKKWHVSTNIMGLNGSTGVLPYHYTELMLKRIKQKDVSLVKFLNLFNHRTVSLFFQASNKYNLPLQYERNKLHNRRAQDHNHYNRVLLSLIGMGTNGLNNRLYTKDESLIYYSGLLSQKNRTATGLRQILCSHFNIPVEIDQFIGQWQDLIDDVRSKLPDLENPKGRNACLGRSAMLGKSGWFAQGKIRIILGPLNKQQLKQFSPGTKALKALHELTRLYVGLENDYEFIIRVYKRDFPTKLQLSKNVPPVIGWNTRLPYNSKAITYDDETLDLSVSSKQLL